MVHLPDSGGNRAARYHRFQRRLPRPEGEPAAGLRSGAVSAGHAGNRHERFGRRRHQPVRHRRPASRAERGRAFPEIPPAPRRRGLPDVPERGPGRLLPRHHRGHDGADLQHQTGEARGRAQGLVRHGEPEMEGQGCYRPSRVLVPGDCMDHQDDGAVRLGLLRDAGQVRHPGHAQHQRHRHSGDRRGAAYRRHARPLRPAGRGQG